MHRPLVHVDVIRHTTLDGRRIVSILEDAKMPLIVRMDSSQDPLSVAQKRHVARFKAQPEYPVSPLGDAEVLLSHEGEHPAHPHLLCCFHCSHTLPDYVLKTLTWNGAKDTDRLRPPWFVI